MITTIVDYGYFIFGLYSLMLILIGTPLNLLCFYIFKRHIPNRSNPTIVVFSYLALIELLIPFTWNLNYIVRELIWKHQKNIVIKNLEQHSLFVCKLISYEAYFLLQCAAWLKTLASFARCVSLHHHWTIRKYISKSNIIHRLSWITILLIGLINLPILIINGKYVISIDKHNQTEIKVACYRSVFFQFWEIVHLLLYNFIPFTLMILCNIYIIRHVHASRQRTQSSRISSNSSVQQSLTIFPINRTSVANHGSRLTKTLVFISAFFIIFTSPSAMFYIFFGKKVKTHRNLITMGLSNLATTSHVSSFIIYWLASTDFRDAIISLFCCRSFISRRQTIEDKNKVKKVPLRTSLSLTPVSNSNIQRKFSSLRLSQSLQ
ncbi:unnamed protein product [Rotaria sp. Silwood2]|nr:unnamed protein product [Rotaria sp. Silwood2]CAF2672342.1 unnamed protein product [Rotaria sp. Silwood2]CAF2934505.1 unnamed protein product [Rotaria sp. Silwood2]CAF3085132.1 unnamed protein product [Rotaria sp. Silwood2]CAF3917627.1 unnamed protein product [Rotaria sp. Silwood2]